MFLLRRADGKYLVSWGRKHRSPNFSDDLRLAHAFNHFAELALLDNWGRFTHGPDLKPLAWEADHHEYTIVPVVVTPAPAPTPLDVTKFGIQSIEV